MEGGREGETETVAYLDLISYTLSNGVKLVWLVFRDRLTKLQQGLSWSVLLIGFFHHGSFDQKVSEVPSNGATTSAPVDGGGATTSTGATGVRDGSTTFTQNLQYVSA